jgi:hypothetical protein
MTLTAGLDEEIVLSGTDLIRSSIFTQFRIKPEFEFSKIK